MERGTQDARRRLDYTVVRRTFPDRAALVPEWAAFSSIAEAELGSPANAPELARVYELELRVRSLVSGGAFHDHWRLRIDASAGAYPAVPPAATFVSHPKPWVPHVNAAGAVCIGDTFAPTTLIARFVIHVIRILNWETGVEVEELVRHFNRDATQYWQMVHHGLPLADLDYPNIEDGTRPVDELFGAPSLVMAGACDTH